jgi:hypothetical protein
MAERKSWQGEVLRVVPLSFIIIILYSQPHTVRFAQYPHKSKIFNCDICTIAKIRKQTAVFTKSRKKRVKNKKVKHFKNKKRLNGPLNLDDFKGGQTIANPRRGAGYNAAPLTALRASSLMRS